MTQTLRFAGRAPVVSPPFLPSGFRTSPRIRPNRVLVSPLLSLLPFRAPLPRCVGAGGRRPGAAPTRKCNESTSPRAHAAPRRRQRPAARTDTSPAPSNHAIELGRGREGARRAPLGGAVAGLSCWAGASSRPLGGAPRAAWPHRPPWWPHSARSEFQDPVRATVTPHKRRASPTAFRESRRHRPSAPALKFALKDPWKGEERDAWGGLAVCVRVAAGASRALLLQPARAIR